MQLQPNDWPEGLEVLGEVDPLVGSEAGDVVLLKKVNEGGTSTIYLGSDPDGSPVAVKVLRRERIENPKFVGQFLNEGTAARPLRHRNVVRIGNAGRLASGEPFIVMEWLEGRPLQQLPPQAMRIQGVLALVSQAAEALSYVHSHGMVHRDVTLDNLYLVAGHRTSPMLKLIDFGLVCRSDNQPTISGGTVMGTPAFMSPEQWMGEPLDARSDLYSLAVVAFRLLTGRLPFAGKTARDFFQAHRILPAPSASMMLPTISPAVSAVVCRALAKRREDRYPSTLEFATALSRAAGSGALRVGP